MRKNQSKYKDPAYIQSLIDSVLVFDNISYIKNEDGYAYFKCSEHSEFRKRFDHLNGIKHNLCPKCSKKIYSKIVSRINSNTHSIDLICIL